MKKIQGSRRIFLALAVWVFPVFLANFAAEAQQDAGIAGRGVLFERGQDRLDQPNFYQLRYQFRVDGWVGFFDNHCLRLQTRVTTGNSFNSEWESTGAGEGEAQIHINIRHLYVDMTCLGEKYRVQVGAMPVVTEQGLGLTDYGWVDGARLIFEDKQTRRRWIVAAGQLNQLTRPNAFDRNFNDFNYAQLETAQPIGPHDLYVSLSHRDGSFYARAGLKLALKQYLHWLEGLKGEILTKGGVAAGNLFQVNGSVAGWKYLVTTAYMKPEAADNNGLLVKNFYGLGRNYYLGMEKGLGKKGTFYFRLRDGDARKAFEAGFTQSFSKKRKLKPDNDAEKHPTLE